jgi:hypothetical protein
MGTFQRRRLLARAVRRKQLKEGRRYRKESLEDSRSNGGLAAEGPSPATPPCDDLSIFAEVAEQFGVAFETVRNAYYEFTEGTAGPLGLFGRRRPRLYVDLL